MYRYALLQRTLHNGSMGLSVAQVTLMIVVITQLVSVPVIGVSISLSVVLMITWPV